MDAFESIVATILQWDGWWVERSVHVNLTIEEKANAGRPTMPRPELDIVAYKGKDNVLRVIECKSFLDSVGVQAKSFTDPANQGFKRYKLFNEPKLWDIVRNALVRQLDESRSCRIDPTVELCLAAAHIVKGDGDAIKELFEERGWVLMDDLWVAQRLRNFSNRGYMNNEAVIATKILERSRSAGVAR